ncbi:MAG: GIY-YIG nuclease family protein [Patescibacteria group bacterium]
MYYVYVLKSKVNDDLYIGSSEDLRVRFKQNNNGEVQSTKGYRPWVLA